MGLRRKRLFFREKMKKRLHLCSRSSIAALDPRYAGQSLAALLTSDFSGKLIRYEESLQRQLSVL
jgi:hypothetical protein